MKIERINNNGNIVHTTVAAMFKNEDKFLIIQKADPSYKKKYSIVAGHVEEGETIEKALIREVLEELGIDINKKYKLINVFENLNDLCRYGVEYHDWYLYEIQKDIKLEELIFDEEEIIKLEWMSLDEIKTNKLFFTSGSTSLFEKLGYF